MLHQVVALAAATSRPSAGLDPIGVVVTIAVFGGIIGIVIFARRRPRKDPTANLFEGLAGIHGTASVGAGEVRLTFHTYNGFFTYVVQRKHDLVLPADQAGELLSRMLKYNCKHGLFAYGAIVIPALSYFEYRSQMKKVRAVLARGFPMDAH